MRVLKLDHFQKPELGFNVLDEKVNMSSTARIQWSLNEPDAGILIFLLCKNKPGGGYYYLHL